MYQATLFFNSFSYDICSNRRPKLENLHDEKVLPTCMEIWKSIYFCGDKQVISSPGLIRILKLIIINFYVNKFMFAV